MSTGGEYRSDEGYINLAAGRIATCERICHELGCDTVSAAAPNHHMVTGH